MKGIPRTLLQSPLDESGGRTELHALNRFPSSLETWAAPGPYLGSVAILRGGAPGKVRVAGLQASCLMTSALVIGAGPA